ncbi:MAG: hypothetical protein SO100_09320 [Dysosmobacter sp.]|nr:hypothetical protein [Dysosmobacter sp.]
MIKEILRDERGITILGVLADVGPRDIDHNGVLAVAVKVAGRNGERTVELVDLHFAELGDILKLYILRGVDRVVVAVGHIKIQSVVAGVQRQIGHILLLAGTVEVHGRRGYGLVALLLGGELALPEVVDRTYDRVNGCPLRTVPVEQAGQAGVAVVPHGEEQFVLFIQGRPGAVAGAEGQVGLRRGLFFGRPVWRGDAEGVLGAGTDAGACRLRCQRRHSHRGQHGQHHHKGECHAQQFFGCLFHGFAPFWGRNFSAR